MKGLIIQFTQYVLINVHTSVVEYILTLRKELASCFKYDMIIKKRYRIYLIIVSTLVNNCSNRFEDRLPCLRNQMSYGVKFDRQQFSGRLGQT